MNYYTAIYLAPTNVLDEWMQKPEAERAAAESEMKTQWDAWMAAHADSVQKTIALGKTKKVSSDGVSDARNGMMLSSYVAAESLEAAAELFKDHPHLGIPGATIEIMEPRPM